MKRLFTTDLTGINPKKNSQNLTEDLMNGSNFRVKKISEETFNARAKEADEVISLSKKAEVGKLWFFFHFMLRLGLFMAIMFAIMSFGSEKPSEDLIPSIIFAVILFVLIILLDIYKFKKAEKVTNGEHYEQANSHFNAAFDQAMNELDIPLTADKIDYLPYSYVVKKGKEHPQIFMNAYSNDSLFIFDAGDNIGFFDLNYRYEIPKTAFKEFHQIRHYITLINWNKETAPEKTTFGKNKVVIRSGLYDIKYYYSLVIDNNGEDQELLVMPYDYDIIRKYLPDLPLVE